MTADDIVGRFTEKYLLEHKIKMLNALRDHPDVTLGSSADKKAILVKKYISRNLTKDVFELLLGNKLS